MNLNKNRYGAKGGGTSKKQANPSTSLGGRRDIPPTKKDASYRGPRLKTAKWNSRSGRRYRTKGKKTHSENGDGDTKENQGEEGTQFRDFYSQLGEGSRGQRDWARKALRKLIKRPCLTVPEFDLQGEVS